MDTRIYCNEGLKSVWLHCLLEANHKKKWFSINSGGGNIEVEIQPGQCVFGRKSWSKILKTKQSTVWDRMKKLELFGYISLKPDRHYTIVTILNWDTYQLNPTNCQQAGEQLPTSCRQAADTNNNDKHYKHYKNDKKIYSVFDVWNGAEIIIHRDIKNFRTCINDSLKTYTVEEISKAIENYKTVLQGKDYFWSYKWSLKEFISRGLEKFLEINNPLENFRRKKDETKRGFDGSTKKDYKAGLEESGFDIIYASPTGE